MAGGGYFLKPPSASDVPNYLTATSPQGLVKAMFENNMRLKGHVQYHSIQFANGKWYAWFLHDLTEDLTNGVRKNGASDNG